MSYNESCQCQSCLNERFSGPTINGVPYYGVGLQQTQYQSSRHIEPVKSLEQRKVEALESIAKLAERIANKLYEGN